VLDKLSHRVPVFALYVYWQMVEPKMGHLMLKMMMVGKRGNQTMKMRVMITVRSTLMIIQVMTLMINLKRIGRVAIKKPVMRMIMIMLIMIRMIMRRKWIMIKRRRRWKMMKRRVKMKSTLMMGY
jgi:hypothetical protein